MRRAWLLLLPLLAGAVDISKVKEQLKHFRLELHLEHEQPGEYFSAWNDGDVISDHDASDGKPVTYLRKFYWWDGCQWEARDVLTPVAADKYSYVYKEGPVSCPDGAVADGSVRRNGFVTVHPTDKGPVTPLVAWFKGWDKPK